MAMLDLFFFWRGGSGKSSNNTSYSGWTGRQCQTSTDYKPRLFLQLPLVLREISFEWYPLWKISEVWPGHEIKNRRNRYSGMKDVSIGNRVQVTRLVKSRKAPLYAYRFSENLLFSVSSHYYYRTSWTDRRCPVEHGTIKPLKLQQSFRFWIFHITFSYL